MPFRNESVVASGQAHAFLIVSLIAFALPTLVDLARNIWSLEQGSQGPVILVSGVWLLLHELRGVTGSPGRTSTAIALLVPSLVIAILSRPLGMLWLQWLSCVGAVVVVLYLALGSSAVRRLWFPIFYLLLLMPPPHLLSEALTGLLKTWIAFSAVGLLYGLGFEVARSGTMLYIDQYELLVADACAGLGSLFGLFSVGLFYVYLKRRTRAGYALLLVPLLIPIAVFANFGRVVILMLATHYFGEHAAQTFVHQPSGFVMFAIALGTLIILDGLLWAIYRRVVRP